jgi:hypothetical protein
MFAHPGQFCIVNRNPRWRYRRLCHHRQYVHKYTTNIYARSKDYIFDVHQFDYLKTSFTASKYP